LATTTLATTLATTTLATTLATTTLATTTLATTLATTTLATTTLATTLATTTVAEEEEEALHAFPKAAELVRVPKNGTEEVAETTVALPLRKRFWQWMTGKQRQSKHPGTAAVLLSDAKEDPEEPVETTLATTTLATTLATTTLATTLATTTLATTTLATTLATTTLATTTLATTLATTTVAEEEEEALHAFPKAAELVRVPKNGTEEVAETTVALPLRKRFWQWMTGKQRQSKRPGTAAALLSEAKEDPEEPVETTLATTTLATTLATTTLATTLATTTLATTTLATTLATTTLATTTLATTLATTTLAEEEEEAEAF